MKEQWFAWLVTFWFCDVLRRHAFDEGWCLNCGRRLE